MADITTVWNQTLGDWVQLGAALQSGDDLTTAILISVFTDAQASPDDLIPDGTGDPRGWWGDLGADKPIGSKLWLRMRSKQTDETLTTVKNDLTTCLAWLIEAGIASAIAVELQWVALGFLGGVITVTQADGRAHPVAFETAWKGVS